VLTDTTKSEIRAKVIELQKLMADAGIRSEVDIRGSDDEGTKQVSLTFENGYWRSSTQSCEDIGVEHENIFTESETLNWDPSSGSNWRGSNC